MKTYIMDVDDARLSEIWRVSIDARHAGEAALIVQRHFDGAQPPLFCSQEPRLVKKMHREGKPGARRYHVIERIPHNPLPEAA